MQKTGFKLIVEAGSAIAVLLGLVFVGLELRQNTEAVEAATFQSLTDASSDYILTLAGDPELSSVYSRGLADVSQLTDAERDRFFYLTRAFWVRMQNVFSQWRRGTLTDTDWQLYREVICGDNGTRRRGDGLVDTFDAHRAILTDEFQAFLESCRTS